ncbi:MAG: hypothetical protein KGJ41_12570 [Rhodospirillales bacterium]|nr:hypothetical protein [Rhodospirillales bacterium]MDE2199844.1 hypothetical protein [Rhodospirillales bacterium]MDE2577050.1 hypothetical protein [Rhodospirillales bacterium]
MSGISGITAATPARGGRGPAAPGRPGFALPDSAAAAQAPLTPATSEATLAGLLGAQAGEAEDVRDRAARRHGHAILAALDSLHLMLLGATPDAAPLRQLAALAAALPAAHDPRLAGVMAAIAQRAAVELARYGLDPPTPQPGA